LVEVVIQFGEATIEPADVVANLNPNAGRCPTCPVLLGDAHLEQLTPTRYQDRQVPSGRIGQWAYLGSNSLGEVCQDLGIDAIGLGELTGGFGEIADLAWIERNDG
jgi:hypothetical protein